MLGFGYVELARLLDPDVKDGLTDPDEATTQMGDQWLLGEHRMVGGDRSIGEHVDRLLDGAAIHWVNTDPPINVKVEPRSNNAIAAGNSSFKGTHHQMLDGAGRCLVDANWANSTYVVYQFSRQSAHSAVLSLSQGRFFGASSVSFSEYRRKWGDQWGHIWRIPGVVNKRAARHVVFDANYWKSFVHARLSVAMADPGCLSFFGADSQRHRMFDDHVTSEYHVPTQARGRTVDEWKLWPDQSDNHWFECLVGSAVAASIQEVELPGADRGIRRGRRGSAKTDIVVA